MFRKRQKKTFPPGTFIPTPARVMAIFQLCLVFTIIAWTTSQPFMGELFSLKSRQLLTYDVMGLPAEQLSGTLAEIAKTKKERLERNAVRFQALSMEQQRAVIDQADEIQLLLQHSFLNKLKRAFYLLAFAIPPFEQAWLLLSLVVPILLLKKVEGAPIVVWLLPLVTLLYAIDNRWYNISGRSAEEKLFPSEKTLVANYLDEPLSADVFVQQTQLMQGWKRYLVIDWAKESPSGDQTAFDLQAENGEFAFNIARLKAKSEDDTIFDRPRREPQKLEPLSVLAIYLFWNLLLAVTASKKRP